MTKLAELLPAAIPDIDDISGGVVMPQTGQASADISLSDLPRGQWATVSRILPASIQEDQELVLRLIEIGFVPDERVRVIAHGHPGREPIALRIGGTTGGASFALRRFEADYIRVVPDVPDVIAR